ncbi:protein kinase domain-containing protein, partial [Actinocorallia aurantiaca]
MRTGLEVAGRYRVGEKLGRGAFGEVWTAEDLLRGRRVAVKFLHRHVADSEPLWLSKFRQEARIAVRLNHPGVTSVEDFGEYDGQWYLVMEFLEGKDLGRELVEHPQGLEPARAVRLIGQVVRALSAAHEHGIVHRDLKPGNLMLLADDEVKICDFGIAHIAEASAVHSLDGRQIGTPAYMAPEQWLGRPVDHRTDLYAVGAILHALLTGAPPFPGPTVTAFMGQHLTLPPPPITHPGTPHHLGELIQRLLHKDPDHRPDHAFVLNSLVVGPPDDRELLAAATDRAGAGDIEAARSWFIKAIESGHSEVAPSAMRDLAILERDQGHDVDAARSWFIKAIESEHPDQAPMAMRNLAFLERNQGNDVDAARSWFIKTIDSEHPHEAPWAMRDLALLEWDQGDVDAARSWFIKALESGHSEVAPSAMRDLAILERDQGNDVEAARSWFIKAIESGHSDQAPMAMRNLAFLERNQRNDVEAARSWFIKTINSEHPHEAPWAMLDLAFLERDQGHDVDAARSWFIKAIESGHSEVSPSAMYNLAILERDQGNV